MNLKGLVGICANKECTIHFKHGSPSKGGDQYPDGLFTEKEQSIVKFKRWMEDQFLCKRKIMHTIIYRAIEKISAVFVRHKIPREKLQIVYGNWYGNDTCWRMVVDLAKIIHFVDKEGKLCNKAQRRLFSVVDGIIGGENDGPLDPDPRRLGILIGGDNMLAVDLVVTRLMDFDPSKLKQFTMLDYKFDFGPRKIEEIEVRSNKDIVENGLQDKDSRFFTFKHNMGWAGHIELGIDETR